MIKYLRQLLAAGNKTSADENPAEEKKLQAATCVLFLEMAKADNEFSENEQKEIIRVMTDTFNLGQKYIDELIEFSEEEIKNSISLYEFTTTINNNFSEDEKFELIKNLWRLIYADQTLDMHEDHLIKKIGVMFNLEHRDLIAAKLMVKEELNKKK